MTLRAIDAAPIAPPAPTLASLSEERAHILAERDRLSAVSAGVAAAQGKLNDIVSEEASLDAAEDEALRQWADCGASGAPPAAMDHRRESLSQRRVLAGRDLAVAHRSAAAVAPRIAVLNGELRRVAVEMFKIKVAAVLANVERVYAKACEANATLASANAELHGFNRALFDLQNEHASDDFASALQNARQQYGTLVKPLSLDVSPSVVQEFVAKWQRALS